MVVYAVSGPTATFTSFPSALAADRSEMRTMLSYHTRVLALVGRVPVILQSALSFAFSARVRFLQLSSPCLQRKLIDRKDNILDLLYTEIYDINISTTCLKVAVS
jgi:hypothetical protein